jgi:hypothetical protein
MGRRSAGAGLIALFLLTLDGCDVKTDMSGPDHNGEGGGGYVFDCPPGGTGVSLLYAMGTYPAQLGDSVKLRAFGSCGTVLGNLMNAWSSTAPAILPITPLEPSGEDAVLYAREVGTSLITLSSQGGTASLMIPVIPRIATVRFSPESATLRVGDSVFVSPVVIDTAGQPVTGQSITYTFNFTGVVENRQQWNGVWFIARKPGTSTIQGEFLFHVGEITITVLAR